LYMGDELRSGDVTTAAASIVAYAEYTSLRDAGREDEAAALLRDIADYNRYDCVSTLRLLDWLRGAADVVDARTPAEELPAVESVESGPPPAVPAEPSAETPRQAAAREARERRLALEARVRDRVGEDRGARDDEAQALAMIGASLGYWRRESKPFW